MKNVSLITSAVVAGVSAGHLHSLTGLAVVGLAISFVLLIDGLS